MTEDSKRPNEIDLAEVGRLVDALERDLARAQRGETGVDRLRGEVEQLRATLARADVAQDHVHRGLAGVRERLHALGDELFDDALKAGDYLARLGRLLGL